MTDDTAVVPDACRTQNADLAWSIDEPAKEPAAELNDPYHHEAASWRRAATIGAVIVASAALIAGGIIRAGDRYGPLPAPAATHAAKPAPAPEKPPAWHLDGTYRVDMHNPEGIIYAADGTTSSMASFRLPTLSSWAAFRTECDPTGCTAHAVILDDVTHQNAAIDGSGRKIDRPLRWRGTQWESAEGGTHGGREVTTECGTIEVWTTLSPMPDGSFRGISHRWLATNECGTGGDHHEVPLTAVRIADAPPPT